MNARIYRGAWIVVAIALVIAAFSVSREQPLTAPGLRPTFDAAAVKDSIDELATLYPDRSPGAPASNTLLQWTRDKFAEMGFGTSVDSFDADIPGLGRRTLTNVSVTIKGRSPTSIVVLAHRDNSGQSPGGGADDNASGTAMMLELARAYRNVEGSSALEPAHTIIFLSTDGGAFGAIGAERFASRRVSGQRVAAALVLDSVGGKGPPRVLINGDRARSPSPMMVATVFQLLEEQPDVDPVHASFGEQLLDLAFPFSLDEQAPFIARGMSAITLTTSGDRPTAPISDTTEQISLQSLTTIGHAAEQLLAALDQGAPEPDSGNSAYLYLGGRFLHGWALQLVLVAALVPALVAIVDLAARCRRRRIELRPALRSVGRRTGFWLSLLVLFLFFSLVGLFPNGVDRPLSPDLPVAGSPGYTALVLFVLLASGAWFLARERLLPKRETSPEEELGGHAAALLVLAAVALLVLVLNRYALIFLLPPLHAWIWLPQLRHLRPWAPLVVLAAGLVGPLLVFLDLAIRLELGGDVFWYVTALASVGYIGLPVLLLVTLFAAATAQLAALSVGRYAPYPAASERPEKNLPQKAARRLVQLSRHWGGARAG